MKPDWKTLNAIYEGTYDGPPVNYLDGCVHIINSRLYWLARSESTRDRWIDENCAPPRLYEFEFVSAAGYHCHGYFNEWGYHYWTGQQMSAQDIAAIDKASIKYL